MKRKTAREAIADRAREAEDRLRRAPLSNLSGSLRDVLVERMKDRIYELWNEGGFEKGDVLLDFLPEDCAQALLDSYFWDDPDG